MEGVPALEDGVAAALAQTDRAAVGGRDRAGGAKLDARVEVDGGLPRLPRTAHQGRPHHHAEHAQQNDCDDHARRQLDQHGVHRLDAPRRRGVRVQEIGAASQQEVELLAEREEDGGGEGDGGDRVHGWLERGVFFC